MRYLIASILLFITSAMYGQENSSLTVLCPENWTISLNGYVQNGSGPKRVLIFYYPDGKKGQTTIMGWVNGEDIILHNEKIDLIGGKNTTVDIRPKDKKIEQNKNGPNFNIFEKTDKSVLKKPGFSSIIDVPKQLELIKLDFPVRQENCTTSY